MKTSGIIIAAVLSLQAGILFNGFDDSWQAGNDETAGSSIGYATPVSPADVTIKVVSNTNNTALDLSSLAPVAPSEADFDDVLPDVNSELKLLAPVTPAEADFNDSTATVNEDTGKLAPVTPAEADFE